MPTRPLNQYGFQHAIQYSSYCQQRSRGTTITFLDLIHRLYLKRCTVYFSKHKVSETGFCFRLQVIPAQLDPIDRASLYLRRWIDKDKKMDNVQRRNICTNVPSS
jgi:hypothetical protein